MPDVLAAIQSHIHGLHDPAFFLLTAEQQIATLLQTLNRAEEPALVVLDAFDRFLHPETNAALAEHGAITLFLEQLQTNLHGSRVLLICQRSPYNLQNVQEQHVRSYLVSRINIPEGVALLQQRGVQGSYEDVSLVWQRCAGHVYSLVLFSTLYKLSRFPLGYFLHAPECHYLWHDEVTPHLVAAVYRYLNPVQRTLMRALSIFAEPVPFKAITTIITAEQQACDTAAYQKELATLLQLALVRQTVKRQDTQGTQDTPCYWLHPLLQQYSTEHYLSGVAQQPERLSTSLGVTGPVTPVIVDEETAQVALAAAHMHAAKYYQELAEEQHVAREKSTGIYDIAPILSTIRHLCLGWHWQQAYDLLLREGLYESMASWGAWDTLIGLYTNMLPPVGVLTRRDEGLVYNHLGQLYSAKKNYALALRCYQDALQLAKQTRAEDQKSAILTNIGVLLFEQGFQAESLALLLYVLKAREHVPYATIDFIQSLLETQKNTLGPQQFTQMCQVALGMQEQLLARLIGR